ncbi:2-keto-4-pentenoate hydratase/2-oxohepta-3-ene-1,7-dioic acid hydratase (catechol pathway) [Fodinibius roseus]|uniref:2-keto-4-pentenoate hydratase/2-oxohepta-3-ene-1,7-dioic acid hydratase (Catechol pathway) n=1 Tax=Fodinibius roseus TaxID=1194090 RepID=A0A1M5DAV4_9BACT|nr:fumarylacetoacetate hydrolase family protein [Fodinibius roseus]SHF64030.1 2-keto-4-pentenoate hydratase/2-oxohepta-3-ene-1,7-dioic acid hydratase (catechol pathway) [Fodinibius roseus]
MEEQKQLPGLPHLNIGSIFCIGRNYVAHARELDNDVPDQPMVFLKPASSITFEGPILLPPQSNEVHHEVELVVALQKGGKDIPGDEALSHVGGYGVGIDVTARDIQARAKQKGHPWSVAKGFDTFAPISTFVPGDRVPDPQDLGLSLTVNDRKRQQSNTRLMIFPVADLIRYLSTIFTLRPGDLIFTGTPEGVSPLRSGDHIEAALDPTLAHLTIEVA